MDLLWDDTTTFILILITLRVQVRWHAHLLRFSFLSWIILFPFLFWCIHHGGSSCMFAMSERYATLFVLFLFGGKDRSRRINIPPWGFSSSLKGATFRSGKHVFPYVQVPPPFRDQKREPWMKSRGRKVLWRIIIPYHISTWEVVSSSSGQPYLNIWNYPCRRFHLIIFACLFVVLYSLMRSKGHLRPGVFDLLLACAVYWGQAVGKEVERKMEWNRVGTVNVLGMGLSDRWTGISYHIISYHIILQLSLDRYLLLCE